MGYGTPPRDTVSTVVIIVIAIGVRNPVPHYMYLVVWVCV